MPDIFQMLTRDHDRIKDLIVNIGENANGDWDKREKMFEELRSALSEHAHFEDEVAFPRIGRELDIDEASVVHEDESEHRQISDMVSRLEMTDSSSQEWDETIRKLLGFFTAHARKEETSFFPMAQQQLPPEIPHELAAQYEAWRNGQM